MRITTLFTFFALFIVFTTQAQQSKLPNIVWISTEDHNPAIGAYQDDYATTPNLDRFASQGIVYTNAFVSSPICAPARSGIITGMHATSLGTQNLRSTIPIPEFIKTLPEVLQEQGYFTTNHTKTDYNFDESGRWDELGQHAHWRNRKKKDQPFFSVFNLGISHESKENIYEDSFFNVLNKRHDPALAQLPPFFPDTEEMRTLWARYYDLISLVDLQFQQILDQLAADGLMENTIVIFWSDHGFGLPRYKRWLTSTGLEVALIARFPDAYQNLSPDRPGSVNDQLISLIDLAPSILSMLDIPIPQYIEGHPFLGSQRLEPRTHFVAHRDRADDVYDMARAVRTKDFLYVRNYYPHLPYIQEALIFGDQKRSYAELKRARAQNELPVYGEAMFRPRLKEELYDLRKDPYELHNIVDDPKYRLTLNSMRNHLKTWIIKTKDSGFLQEGEMMRLAGDSSVYEVLQDENKYPIQDILAAAEMVGDNSIPLASLKNVLMHKDSKVAFWGVIALKSRLGEAWRLRSEIKHNLTSSSPSTAIAAAELLCELDMFAAEALTVLKKYLFDDREWIVLQAAISIRQLGDKISPLKDEIIKSRLQYTGDRGLNFSPFQTKVGYKNFSYPLFIGFALDQALVNMDSDFELAEYSLN